MHVGSDGIGIGNNVFTVSSAGALVATSATITGTITATAGTIGSFTIGTYLYTGTKTAYNDANAGVHVGSDGIGIGNNVFTVNGSTGALVATSATITGAITASSGSITGAFTLATTGTFSFGATAILANDGLWMDYVAGVPRLRIGTVAAGALTLGLYWDGLNLSWAGVNTSLTAAGAFVATSATITGAITATSGTIGSFTIGTYLYTGTKTAYNDANAGVHVGSDGIGIGNNVFTVSSAGALVATNATITGTITATNGAIGGFNIGSDAITDVGNSFGLASTVTAGDDVRGWAGATYLNRATAPLRWTESGAFVATSATITGAITASSGSLSGLSVTGTLTLSGSGKLITAASPAARIELSTTLLAGYSDATTKQFYIQASDGKAYFGGGSIVLDSTGALFSVSPTQSPTTSSLYWNQGANLRAWLWVNDDGVATNAKVSGFCIQKANNTAYAGHTLQVLNAAGATVGKLEVAVSGAGQASVGVVGYFYPGAAAASQSTDYLYWADAASGIVISGRISTIGRIYPGTGAAIQNTRYISDNGSNIVVDGVVVATHTHTGGAGGTVAMSSLSGTISTTQHGALGTLANAHAVADITGAAPLASPTFTGNVSIGIASQGRILDIASTGDAVWLHDTAASAVDNGLPIQWRCKDTNGAYQTVAAMYGLVQATGAGGALLGYLSLRTDNNTERLRIASSGAVRMSGYGAGTATFDASGNITSVSDERLKTDIHPLPYGLKELLQWKPISHQWTDASGLDTVETYHGFLAQNIQESAPGLVKANKEGWLSYEDRGVLGTAVNSIQELHARIATLERELASLKHRGG